jgi:hypothetical protein
MKSRSPPAGSPDGGHASVRAARGAPFGYEEPPSPRLP